MFQPGTTCFTPSILVILCNYSFDALKMFGASWQHLLKLSLILLVFIHTGCAHVCKNLTFHKESGDVVIAGIFPVHYYSSSKKVFVYNKPGLLWVQSMLFAIDEINSDPTVLPGVKLGYAIYDSCNNADFGLQSALDIVREPEILPAPPAKISVNEAASCHCKKASNSSLVIGVVGDAASSSSTRIASVLGARSWSVGQISYSSTSTDLSNKKYYPSFLRTIPPDNFQAMFIRDILRKFNWTYVSVVASDDAYGRVGVENLRPILAREKDICLAVNEVFDANVKEGQITTIIKKLLQAKEAKVVILWCQRPEALEFLKKAWELGLTGRTWIATETWGSTSAVYDFDKQLVGGMLGIVPSFVEYSPFEKHLRNITPNKVQYNPWLNEYWRNTFGCKVTTIDSNGYYSYKCDPRYGRPTIDDLPRNKYTNVMDAIKAIAVGLHNYLEKDSIFKKSLISNSTPETILQYIWNVSFIGKANLPVQFDDNGNPRVASYSLMNLRSNNGKMKFELVGNWDSGSRNLKLNSTVVFSNDSLSTPRSACAEECSPGYHAMFFTTRSCCWTCVPCPSGQIQPLKGLKHCNTCKGDTVPNQNRTKCLIPAHQHLTIDSTWGIIFVFFSFLMIVLCVFVVAVIMWFWNTPIAKAMNRELSLLQLCSMVFIFAMPAFYLIKPFSSICIVRPFYLVTFYSISVTVTFTKADRLLRVFKASKSGRLSRTSRVLDNRVQLVTVFILTVGGCFITGLVCLFLRPELEKKVTTLSKAASMAYSCGENYDILILVLLGYIFAIAFTCSVFAFKARKLPENYNEARYTSFAMFSFCLAWLCFAPLYFSMQASADRDFVMCVLSFLATSCMLLITYALKIYIMLFKPEENTTEHFRAKIRQPSTQGRRSGSGSISESNPSKYRRHSSDDSQYQVRKQTSNAFKNPAASFSISSNDRSHYELST